ncbi:MAG: pilus assembly protein CpaC, partial [Planctomycetes bacterium]|nr:pilus assembly protein CpaC [Planctomycetota bacterium]
RREGVPGGGAPAGGAGGVGPGGAAGTLPGENPAPGQAQPEPETIIEHGQITASAGIVEPHIINLIRVPGSQQVLLKVRVAELDRSALRSIGADFIGQNPAAGAIFGTQIGGSSVAASAQFAGSSLTGTATGATTSSTTVFGIFDRAHFEFLLNILKTNGVMKILAEPDLVTMSGHPASFLAGGEFPVPIPQASGVGGGAVVTVAFKEFGVRLGFVPYVLDGNVIRLTVDPEVSAIDQSVAATLVQGGSPVPGITTRKTHTTVELVQGQTLAIAGLLQLSLAGNTARIPVLGDLPILGPFFSNTSSNRTEKELVVLVTPYLVEPMNKEQVPPSPGEEYKEPNNLELFLLNRIEGRTGQDYRSTIRGEEPLRIRQELKLEKDHVRGPCGFSE